MKTIIQIWKERFLGYIYRNSYCRYPQSEADQYSRIYERFFKQMHRIGHSDLRSRKEIDDFANIWIEFKDHRDHLSLRFNPTKKEER